MRRIGDELTMGRTPAMAGANCWEYRGKVGQSVFDQLGMNDFRFYLDVEELSGDGPARHGPR